MILSDLYVNKILDLFRGEPIEPIEKMYVGLLDSSGSELTASSYARVELDANLATWYSTQNTIGEVSTGTTRKITNAVTISWGTALENWGNVGTVRFYTSETGDDYIGDHTVSENIVSGTTVDIVIGDFSIEM